MRRQRGFSLVELMVAITLALLLTGAVVSVFIGSRTAYQATAGVGDMADSGRFALNMIGDSVRSAGNIACNSANSGTSLPLPAAQANGFITNFTLGISGFEAKGSAPGFTVALPQAVGAAGNWNAALDGSITAATAGAFGVPVQGSDMLVLYSSKRTVLPVYTTADVLGGVTTLPVSAPPTGPSIAPNDYVAISDCTKSLISQAGAVAANSVTFKDPLTLGFATGAFVTPLTTTVYYIGTGSDGDSSLWRIELVNGAFPAPGPQSPEELVPDVENMQVLYGIDPAGTGTASAYVTANNIGAFNVASIQIALLVASPPGNKPVAAPPAFNLAGTLVTVPGDNRARQVFYATINLRNASS